jgi:hypothetical protein
MRIKTVPARFPYATLLFEYSLWEVFYSSFDAETLLTGSALLLMYMKHFSSLLLQVPARETNPVPTLSLTGGKVNPMPESTISPSQGL